MENKIAIADTSKLIDYFRKSDKSNSIWLQLFDKGFDLNITTVTEFEIYSGATPSQLFFWNELLKNIKVLSFDQIASKQAVLTHSILKRKRKQIDLADLFIASIAIANGLPLATLNRKHFERVENLILID